MNLDLWGLSWTYHIIMLVVVRLTCVLLVYVVYRGLAIVGTPGLLPTSPFSGDEFLLGHSSLSLMICL